MCNITKICSRLLYKASATLKAQMTQTSCSKGTILEVGAQDISAV